MPAPKLFVLTHGCQMNEYDSAKMADVLARSHGYIRTHDAEEAMAVADQIALMNKGVIVQTGAPDRLYLSPVSETAARLLGDVEAFITRVESGRASTPLGHP